MPTIAGSGAAVSRRKRSATLCRMAAKKENVIAWPARANGARDLNRRALRAMAVLKPLKVVIENYPDDQVERSKR